MIPVVASLSDLSGVFTPTSPVGFRLGDIDLASSQNRALAEYGIGNMSRTFQKYDLPDLLSGQAARGAFASGATTRKTGRLASGVQGNISNLLLSLAPEQAKLAMNGLLAQTGVQLGGV